VRAAVEVEQAARIHHAETRWLQQSAARLQRASLSRQATPRTQDEEAPR
jgi:hypothetical protein